MRHKRIYQKALLLDQLIDGYKKSRKRRNFPHKIVREVMPVIFKGTKWSGRGAFKSVYKVFSPARALVLKTSNAKSIRRDLRVYKRLPATVRNRYFAKIYWATKYSLLAEIRKGVQGSTPYPFEAEGGRKELRYYRCPRR